MRHRIGLLAGVLLGLTTLASTAPGAGQPRAFLARYHLSAYGVYHETWVDSWTAVPCKPGSTNGGGQDGARKQVETIRWETVLPGIAIVTRILPGLPPTMAIKPGPNVEAQGVIATATVTRATTGTLDSVSCHLDGTEERLAVPFGKACGTHTYRRGYVAGVGWPVKVGSRMSQFTVTLEGLESTHNRLNADYKNCYGPAAGEFGPEINGRKIVSGTLPFAELPRKLRGRITKISHGQWTIDTHGQQGGSEGGAADTHHHVSATSYVTFVRIR